MKLWKNVLVQVDARQDAPSALEESLSVAEAFGGRVIAFDSISPTDGPLPFEYPALRADHLLEFAVVARAQQLREKLAALDSPVPVEATVARGAPGRALLAYAEHRDADLIIQAASASDLEQMTHSGAGTLHILRESAVPVLLFAPRKRRSGRVLAAVSLSSTQSWQRKLNERVVLGAARLSLVQNAELHVVCVADNARDRMYQSILRPAQYRRYLAQDRHELRRSLTQLVESIGPRSFPHFLEGDPLEELASLATELDVDSIALGRDAAQLCGNLYGSQFAERLFCRVERSLLLVPPEPRFMRARANPAPRARQPERTEALGAAR